MSDILRLDQNTNLLGRNPAVARIDARGLDLAQYPDPDAGPLRQAIAAFVGMPPDQVVATNGSDEGLGIAMRALCGRGDVVATTVPGYDVAHHAQAAGAKLRKVPMRANLTEPDVDALLATTPKLVVVATPNNPTGARLPAPVLDDLAERVRDAGAVLAIDEAYIEYAGLRHSLLRRAADADHLVVLRTFSKAYGLAGLRVGWMASGPGTARRLADAAPTHNIGSYQQALAAAALEEQEWLDACVRTVREQRADLAERLKRLGCRVRPSDANFLLVETPVDAGEVRLRLRDHGILVARPGPPLQDALRITVGGAEHSDRLVTAMRDVLGRM